MKTQGNVLIVDDNAVNTWLAVRLCEKIGWVADSAVSGKSALAALRERKFDLVLLDLRMPGMQGTEVCGRIRRELGLTDLFVVAYTAHCTEQDNLELQNQGFDALLIKPATLAAFQRLCERARQGRTGHCAVLS